MSVLNQRDRGLYQQVRLSHHAGEKYVREVETIHSSDDRRSHQEQHCEQTFVHTDRGIQLGAKGSKSDRQD